MVPLFFWDNNYGSIDLFWDNRYGSINFYGNGSFIIVWQFSSKPWDKSGSNFSRSCFIYDECLYGISLVIVDA